jgi:hypothetical protein
MDDHQPGRTIIRSQNGRTSRLLMVNADSMPMTPLPLPD